MQRLLAAAIVAGALCLGAAAPVAADVIPGDDACQPWEHWEGHHDGECKFGCSVSAPASGAGEAAGWVAAATLAAAALLFLRRR